MPFDPLSATGLVLADFAGVKPRITGTCFLLRYEHYAITAAHCVPAEATSLTVALPRQQRAMPVTSITRHPTADVALLSGEPSVTEKREGYPERSFWDCPSNWALGEQFMAYGFPEETNSEGPIQATPRLFVGHYQRFFEFNSPSNFRYTAGEMSVPAPAGLSGGPVFRPNAPMIITGLVTTNYDSFTITDSVDEILDDGTKYKAESRRIVSYGIALMLSAVKPWLKDLIPDRQGAPW
jgi:S1-C subfamily serine protease